MYPRFLQLFLNNQIENLTAVFNDEYDTPSHTKKVFANMIRQGKDFFGTVTPLFAIMLIQSKAVEGEGSRQPTKPQHTPTTALPSHVEPIPTIASSSHPKKTHKHEIVHEKRGEIMEKAATTAISLDKEQGSSNIIRTQSMATLTEPIPQRTGSGSSPRRQDTILGDRPAQTSMKLNELMEIYTKLSERVLALENIKTAQDLEITNLKKRVKKLEKKKKSRTPQLKRRLFKVRIESSAEKSLGDQEDASKQGRNEIDQDEGISWFQEDAETQGRYGHDTEINTASTSITTASINITTVEPVITASAPIATAGVSVSTAEPSTPPTTTTTFIEDEDLTIAQTLMKMRKASETATRPIVPPQQQLDPKDKGKGIMQEPEKLVKVKGKDQIEYDADMAKRLQAELDEEVRLEREREEEDSNIALIEEWDTIKARIDVDAQLTERLQAEEREQIAKEQRNKPPTKAEQRKKLCTYMKHMAGYKDKDFKGKSFNAIKQMFDKAYKQVNDFVPMDTESSRKKAASKKRAGERPSKESAKRQKIEDDAEKAELKACLEIVLGDDSAVNIESLAIKYPIVDWKTHILAEDKMYYLIIRADGSIKYYKIFSAMLDDFDKQDVLDLYRLVKERFESTSLEGYDRLLWGDLITLFEPSEEDEIWKAQQDYTLISWRGGLLGIKGFLTVTTAGSSYNCWLELLLLLKIEEKNGTIVRKGDPIPNDQCPPVHTTPPLAIGALIPEKSPLQRSVEKPNAKIAAAREKKGKQALAKA
ncbi:hypothetical protein Tco_0702946 [Tanacetum coccineum]|uniref:Uncharacterized protein n=1 Tax=Tanacetum coccineum TaxID=301880 RepID=A0ABQ4XZ67_9ASTR